MPTLSDLRKRTSPVRPLAASVAGEEAIVADRRSRMRPAQIVELKLRTALGPEPLSRESNAPPRPRS